MKPIVFKTNTSFCYQNKDRLHEEIIRYVFIEYIGKSRIDNEYMYKLHRQDIIVRRVHKMNNVFKRMNKRLVSIPPNIDQGGTDIEANNFLDKYRQYMILITLFEDHLPNYNKQTVIQQQKYFV